MKVCCIAMDDAIMVATRRARDVLPSASSLVRIIELIVAAWRDSQTALNGIREMIRDNSPEFSKKQLEDAVQLLMTPGEGESRLLRFRVLRELHQQDETLPWPEYMASMGVTAFEDAWTFGVDEDAAYMVRLGNRAYEGEDATRILSAVASVAAEASGPATTRTLHVPLSEAATDALHVDRGDGGTSVSVKMVRTQEAAFVAVDRVIDTQVSTEREAIQALRGAAADEGTYRECVDIIHSLIEAWKGDTELTIRFIDEAMFLVRLNAVGAEHVIAKLNAVGMGSFKKRVLLAGYGFSRISGFGIWLQGQRRTLDAVSLRDYFQIRNWNDPWYVGLPRAEDISRFNVDAYDMVVIIGNACLRGDDATTILGAAYQTEATTRHGRWYGTDEALARVRRVREDEGEDSDEPSALRLR